MNTVKKIMLCLNILGWMLLSCNNPTTPKPDSQATVAEEGGVLNEGQSVQKAPVQRPDLYVKAISGLRLRKAPDPSSEQLMTIPFGARIQALDSISGTEIVIDGRKGRMIEVQYENHQGFVFDGLTTAGPSPNTARLQNGKYCFKSYGIPGYEYRSFMVEGNQITQGSGDGHTASEEESWILSFTGIFDEEGNLLIKAVVENSSGVQAPCLETWEITRDEYLVVKSAGSKALRFKKVDCVRE